MEETPSPINRVQRKPLNDVTPPPATPPHALRGVFGAANASVRCEIPDPARSLQRAESGLFLQRFTLKSRRSAPYPEVPVQPGVPSLKPPNRLLRSGELPVALVQLCNCSWKGTLEPNGQRLCQQDTDQHDEYRLLEAMSRRFAVERAAQGDNAEPEVARMAANQKLQVHFILEPIQEVVVGYVALQKAPSGSKQFLHQVYVEPECRRLGFATTALRLILGKTSSVALPSPSPMGILLMGKVGFTDGRELFPAGAQEVDDVGGWTNFHRAPPANGMWEDQWNNE